MAVVSKLIIDGEDLTQHGNSTISNINYGGVDYHFAKNTENIGGYCENAVEEPIIDLKVSGNSIQNGTPTPEAPIEIESVGERTRNLFNNTITPYKEQNVRVEPYEKGIKVISTAAASTSSLNAWYSLGDYASNVGKSYTLTIKQTNNLAKSVYFGFIKGTNGLETISTIKSTRIENGQTDTISATIPEDESVDELLIRLYFYNDAVGAEYILDNFMLEDGLTATEYEPYGYKIPVNVSGKNLINKETSQEGYFINSSGAIATNETYGLAVTEKIYVKPSTTYTYSGMGNVRATTVGRTGFEYNEDGNPITSIASSYGENVIFTTNANCNYVRLIYVKTEEKPMLEENTTATEYQPYNNTTTNIYLKEPLRKVDKYIDYIDYKNKKVVRYVRNISLNVADMNNNLEDYAGWADAPYLKQDYPNVNTAYFGTYTTKILSNITNDENKGIGVNTLYSNAGLFFPQNIWGLTQTEWKITYPDLVFNLLYGLQTPYEETIDIPEISTGKGRNNFVAETTLSPSELKINYWKQIGVEETTEHIQKSNTDILIIRTGANIAQSGSNLTIGE